VEHPRRSALPAYAYRALTGLEWQPFQEGNNLFKPLIYLVIPLVSNKRPLETSSRAWIGPRRKAPASST